MVSLSHRLINRALLLMKRAASLPSVSDFDTTEATSRAAEFLANDIDYIYTQLFGRKRRIENDLDGVSDSAARKEIIKGFLTKEILEKLRAYGILDKKLSKMDINVISNLIQQKIDQDWPKIEARHDRIFPGNKFTEEGEDFGGLGDEGLGESLDLSLEGETEEEPEAKEEPEPKESK